MKQPEFSRSQWNTIKRVLEMQAEDYSHRYEIGKTELLNLAYAIKLYLDD